MKIKDYLLQSLAPKQSPTLGLNGVTLYGDSILWAMKYPLEEALNGKLEIANRAIPGDTARNAWIRFPYELRPFSEVVIQTGTNDLTVGDSPIDYIEKMVEMAQAQGCHVILTGISARQDNKHIKPNSEIFSLAVMKGCGYANWPSVALSSPDGLHPDKEMQKHLVDLLAAQI